MRESATTIDLHSDSNDSSRLFRGHRGGVIPMHRALAHFQLVPLDLVTAALILVFFSVLWLVLLPAVCRLWAQMLLLGLRFLPLTSHFEVARYNLTIFQLAVPSLHIASVFPGLQVWTVNCAITVVAFVLTFFVSPEWLPAVYLSRIVLLVHGSALVYFAIWPASFSHTPNSYIEGLITASLGLISMVPLLFALTYYIFDFGLLKKLALTAITMGYLVLVVPFQVLLQALLLQKSLLFMPMLYIIFGIPIDILLIIAFYSWAMTWAFRIALPTAPTH